MTEIIQALDGSLGKHIYITLAILAAIAIGNAMLFIHERLGNVPKKSRKSAQLALATMAFFPRCWEAERST